MAEGRTAKDVQNEFGASRPGELIDGAWLRPFTRSASLTASM
jgi:hypothetical protein